MEGGNAMCVGLSLSFFIGSHSTSLFPLYLIPHCFSLSASSLISPSPFFSSFHTNSLSIFKRSYGHHLFLSSIYTSACLLVIKFVILSTVFSHIQLATIFSYNFFCPLNEYYNINICSQENLTLSDSWLD